MRAGLDVLHPITDAALVVAGLSVASALAWYLWRMRHRAGGLVGAGFMTCAFVLASAVAHVARILADRLPDQPAIFAVEVAAAAVTVVLAIMVWPLIPALFAMPTRRELMEMNRALCEEQRARRAAADELEALNLDLERRIAERTRELAAARRRFELALDGSAITVAQQDRDLAYTWIHNPPPAFAGADFVGRSPADLLPTASHDRLAALKRRVLDTGRGERFVVPLAMDGGTLWFEGRVEPLMIEERVEGLLTVAVDITRHKEQEREMSEVLRELTHRSKNLLAVIQGIARQSAVGIDDMTVFDRLFRTRLQALAVVHEILVANRWRGVGLRSLVEGVTGRNARRLAAALEIDGPELRLAPETAQSFALAVNELVVPWAGLSVSRISVAWTGDDAGVTGFLWRMETKGPRPDPSPFGRLFLDRLFPRAIGAHPRWSTGEDGITYAAERAPAPIALPQLDALPRPDGVRLEIAPGTFAIRQDGSVGPQGSS